MEDALHRYLRTLRNQIRNEGIAAHCLSKLRREIEAHRSIVDLLSLKQLTELRQRSSTIDRRTAELLDELIEARRRAEGDGDSTNCYLD